MPRGGKTLQEATDYKNATPANVWAMMTNAHPELLASWDYNESDLALVVGETMQTGAAITFGGKRDLSGMSVRVFAGGAVVLQAYFDNCFELNEWLKETGGKLRNIRLAAEAKAGQP